MKTGLKVLQVGKYYAPEVGGIETVTRNLSEGLSEKGVDVSVLCFGENLSEISEGILNRVRIVRVPYSLKFLSQPLSLSYRSTLIELAQTHDLVHFHVPNPLAELALPSLPPDQPVIATYHADVTRQKLLLPFYRPVLQNFLNRVNRVLVPTENHITYSQVLPSYREKCEVVPFGIKTEIDRENQEFISLSHHLRTQHGKFILFVGRLVPYKGVSVLLEAIGLIKDKIPDHKLIVVGSGPIEETLKNQVNRLGIEERVHFTGTIRSDLELNAYYGACEFLVLPSISRAEAFGMVLLEAMNYSKPLITTRLKSGVTEVNTANVTGLEAEPGDSKSLAEAILKLTSNPTLLAEMGAAARSRYLTRYTFERMIQETLRIYEGVVNTRR